MTPGLPLGQRGDGGRPARIASLAKVLGWLVTLLPALVFGMVASSLWLEVLSFFHRVPFDVTEPVFGQDVSFYVFELPMIAYARSIAVGVVVISIIASGVYYLFNRAQSGRASAIPVAGIRRLLALAGVLFFLAAVGWWLDRYDLLFQKDGAVWGVGYTDEHAHIPAFGVMAVVSVLVGASMLKSAMSGALKLPVTALGGYFIASMLLTSAWPGVVQEYSVKPNELGMESPYLERNIENTRAAFALERIEVKPFDASTDLTMDDLEANPQTIENIRVWDDRPLLTTLRQMQEIRSTTTSPTWTSTAT